MSVVLAAVSDLHVNSTIGLCPSSVERDDGGTYLPTKAQRWLTSRWTKFWDEIEQEAEHAKADEIWVVIGGEAVDMNRKDGLQLVTGNETIALDMAAKVLDRPRRLASEFFVLRGSFTHVGGQGYLDEKVARDMDATGPTDRKEVKSWYHLPLEVEGVQIDFQHHPRARGHLPHTQGPSATRQAAIVFQEYWKMGVAPPHIAVYGHVHYWADSGTTLRPRVFYLSPWQLTTSYGFRLGAGAHIEPPGGLALVCRDGNYTARTDLRYKPLRRPRWSK